jgi:cytochrome c biogenesis protein CcmG/thiol:disulfide interchange protein DsbE
VRGPSTNHNGIKGESVKRMIKDWAVALSLGMVVFFGIQWLQPKPTIPEIAPDFTVKTIDGDSITLSDLRGKTVVLNFWATWCGPCRSEIPAFSRFSKAHPDVPVLGLSVDQGSPAKVRHTVREWGIEYPVAIISDALQKKYDISTLPTTVIIDADGKVQKINVGTMSESQLTRAIR